MLGVSEGKLIWIPIKDIGFKEEQVEEIAAEEDDGGVVGSLTPKQRRVQQEKEVDYSLGGVLNKYAPKVSKKKLSK